MAATMLTTGNGAHALFISAGVPDSTLGQDGDSYIDNVTTKLYWRNAGVWTDTGSSLLAVPSADITLLAFQDGKFVAADPSLTASGAQITAAQAQAQAATTAATNAQTTASSALTAAASAQTAAIAAQAAATSSAQSAAIASGSSGSLTMLAKLGIAAQPTSAPFQVTGAALGSTKGNVSETAWLTTFAGTNAMGLHIQNYRIAAGTDWTTSGTRILGRVDVTDMAGIQFSNFGMQFLAAAGQVDCARMATDGSFTFDKAVTIPTPTVAAHAANKAYVDAILSGNPVFQGTPNMGSLLVGNTLATYSTVPTLSFVSAAVPSGKPANAFDAQIRADSGTNGTNGIGNLTYQASAHSFQGLAHFTAGLDVYSAVGGKLVTAFGVDGSASIGASLKVYGNQFELGAQAAGSAATTTYQDFHSSGVAASGAAIDYDGRIQCDGGSQSKSGQGTLSYTALSHNFNGSQVLRGAFSLLGTDGGTFMVQADQSGNLTIGGKLVVGGAATVGGSPVLTAGSLSKRSQLTDDVSVLAVYRNADAIQVAAGQPSTSVGAVTFTATGTNVIYSFAACADLLGNDSPTSSDFEWIGVNLVLSDVTNSSSPSALQTDYDEATTHLTYNGKIAITSGFTTLTKGHTYKVEAIGGVVAASSPARNGRLYQRRLVVQQT